MSTVVGHTVRLGTILGRLVGLSGLVRSLVSLTGNQAVPYVPVLVAGQPLG
jgi:hypothetical protein